MSVDHIYNHLMVAMTQTLRQMTWPTDWGQLFGRQATLIVEIGFGNGEFLINLSNHYPEANILGLEVSRPSIEKAERRIARKPSENLLLIQTMAQPALWLLCQPNQIQSIYINFPDPWPKAGHHRRRLIDDRFLHLAATRMIPGAVLEIATDHTEYAEWIYEALSHSPFFVSQSERPYESDDGERFRTKYEQKALSIGKQCYYFKWKRVENDVPDPFGIPKDLPMPHAIVNISLSLNQIGEEFKANEYNSDEITIRFIEIYTSQNYRSLIVDTFIREDWLDQRLLLSISERKPNEYQIQVHEVGFPRATSGVHLAIHTLATWLSGLDSGGNILRHNLRNLSDAKK